MPGSGKYYKEKIRKGEGIEKIREVLSEEAEEVFQ